MHIAKLVLVTTAGVAASGSIALAATQGSQPSEPGRVLPTNAASQAQEHAAPVLAEHPSGKPADAGNSDATHPAPHGSPHPNLNGLCHAWLAGAGAEHGHARSNPAFSVLVATAGGSDAVDGYCTTLLGSSSHPSGSDSDEPGETDSNEPPSHPNQSSHPGKTAHPGRTSHPGNTTHPGASDHPSGRPTATPPVTPPVTPPTHP
jgi:hypothetical protein